MAYKYNDGGRQAAGYKGIAGDCGARALAIALELDYKSAYKQLAQANADHGCAKSARNGISKQIFSQVLAQHGWRWVKAPKFFGRKARYNDVPVSGRYIVQMAGHFAAVVDGVLHDSWDSRRKMVYGYWAK
jgi:hypothetical protein